MRAGATRPRQEQAGRSESGRAGAQALIRSGTHPVPLFHHNYAGNESDDTMPARTLESLAKIHTQLGEADRTLVRDCGFAGTQLDLDLAKSGYRSVSVLALSTTASREALAAAVGRLEPLSGKLHKVGAWRTRTQVDGLDRTLVVVDSAELLEGQLRGLSVATKKARKELRKIAARLEKERAGVAKGRHYTAESLRHRIDKLTRREHVREVLRIEIGGDQKHPTLAVTLDAAGKKRLIEERLGKRVLVTDQHEWTSERIVRAFRSQWKVERAFRRMKRGAVSPWGPSYQWTTDSLRAHTFATVLGLQLATLVRLKLQRSGIKRTTKGCMKLLAGIRLTRLLARQRGLGGPREIFVPARLESDGRRAVEVFGLDRWTPLFSATRRKSAGRRGKRA